jgi:hypothetical protein
MLIVGTVVWVVGLTQVVLPYDLAFLGISRDSLTGMNPRILSFMQHDRITFAGTLMSIGVLYSSLAWNGIRCGWRWARRALAASAAVGFASLFLFLGFHYVDPLHVALTAGLLPLFVLGLVLPARAELKPARDLDSDVESRLAFIGRLLFFSVGIGLITAGLTITIVGISSVFVFSDLEFLRATAADLTNANEHLLPLVAHDRAGFGGALTCDGVAVLLLALSGFRRGARWVWWTLLISGLVGLASTVYAHVAVGYLEFAHLLPVLLSAVASSAALAFSARYLLTVPPGSLSSEPRNIADGQAQQ